MGQALYLVVLRYDTVDNVRSEQSPPAYHTSCCSMLLKHLHRRSALLQSPRPLCGGSRGRGRGVSVLDRVLVVGVWTGWKSADHATCVLAILTAVCASHASPSGLPCDPPTTPT